MIKKTDNSLDLNGLIPLMEKEIKKDKAIKLRAAKYYLETELYDLTLPGFWSNHNEWIPRGDFLNDSSKFARKQRQIAISGLSPDEKNKLQFFTQEYARFSIDRLKDEIEYLEKNL